jgi:hypothetical protein
MNSKSLKQIPGLFVPKTAREKQRVLSSAAICRGREVTMDNVLRLYVHTAVPLFVLLVTTFKHV